MSVSFSVGNEHAPDDPFGRIVLEIAPDGAAKLEHFSRAGNGAWTGRMEPEQWQRLKAALERGGFPRRPPHPMPVPGMAIFELGLEDDTLIMPVDAAAKVDGYGEALEILEAFARELSGGAYGRARASSA